MIVPNPDYVLTLDADSVLLPEYCLRLVHLLEQSEYQDVAVAQTPYSAFPGSATRLERIAGATTDLQHIVHQGLTYYDATFWVGANAVIRKQALDEIAETSYIGDWEIRHYIQDRTVIEDTESTIDLGIHGWRLFNYPERLSYSATPPDFGSLCIQRRRWANGGLLILPKLRRTVPRAPRRGRADQVRRAVPALELHGVHLLELGQPADPARLPVQRHADQPAARPGRAALLPRHGQRPALLRVQAHRRAAHLRLQPDPAAVNLAGTLSSIVQGITASKAPFARTPKVRDRTVVAAVPPASRRTC